MEKIINGAMARTIRGFNRYMLSTDGRIYRVMPVKLWEIRLLNEKPEIQYFHEIKFSVRKRLAQGPSLFCGLIRNNGKVTTLDLPTLMIRTFMKPLPKHEGYYYKIEYRDGNFRNCKLDNLYYEKRQKNSYILQPKDVIIIKGLINEGYALRKIAKKFGVCEMQINRIKTGENWSKKGRTIFPNRAPIKIDDPKIRRMVSFFKATKIKDESAVSYFRIKRNPECGTDNLITGRVRGFRFEHSHKNITRANRMVYRLNEYFFGVEIADKMNDKNIAKIAPPVCGKKAKEIEKSNVVELSGMKIQLV